MSSVSTSAPDSEEGGCAQSGDVGVPAVGDALVTLHQQLTGDDVAPTRLGFQIGVDVVKGTGGTVERTLLIEERQRCFYLVQARWRGGQDRLDGLALVGDDVLGLLEVTRRPWG